MQHIYISYTSVIERPTVGTLRWSPKFGQVVKSGFCSQNNRDRIGGAGHETEPKEAQPII
jgi:hypothetical protein